jgi:molecular chaperone DnaK
LKDLDDKMSDEDKADLSSRMEAVREALKGTDAGAIDSTKQQLAEALQRVGTKAYEPTPGGGDGSAGGNGAAAGEQPAEEEGETIEGEYKEV